MGLKKLGKWLKKNIKPIATVAAVVFPPLAPAIGAALGATGAAAAVVGSAALGAGASVIAGDKPEDVLKSAVVGGAAAGVVNAVAPDFFTSSGLLSTPTAPAATGTTTTSGVSGGLMGSTLPAGAGAGATTAASLSSEIASKGLVGDLLTKASALTGISEDTLGKLGSAAVSTLLNSAGASAIADKAEEAARIKASADIEAAKIAADAVKFRPVGVTTRFGTSNFGYDAEGNVVTAGYTPSAEITGYQDRLKKLADLGLSDVENARTEYQPLTGAARSLFSLGESYLSKSPEQAAADYIAKQQELINPSRQNQLAELQNKLFQQGRGGAATARGGNLMATSPELAAYYNAIALQDLTLAAKADEEARNRITYGAGLFDTGANLKNKYYSGLTGSFAPFATTMDTSTGLESLAERPLTLGTSIGAKTTAGTAEAGKLLSSGITNAAATMYPSNAYSASGNFLSGVAQNPTVTGALNNAFGVSTAPKYQIVNGQLVQVA